MQAVLLEPIDREILVLRGIEQQGNHIVSTLLGFSPQAISMRVQRAQLPDSNCADLREPLRRRCGSEP